MNPESAAELKAEAQDAAAEHTTDAGLAGQGGADKVPA